MADDILNMWKVHIKHADSHDLHPSAVGCMQGSTGRHLQQHEHTYMQWHEHTHMTSAGRLLCTTVYILLCIRMSTHT